MAPRLDPLLLYSAMLAGIAYSSNFVPLAVRLVQGEIKDKDGKDNTHVIELAIKGALVLLLSLFALFPFQLLFGGLARRDRFFRPQEYAYNIKMWHQAQKDKKTAKAAAAAARQAALVKGVVAGLVEKAEKVE